VFAQTHLENEGAVALAASRITTRGSVRFGHDFTSRGEVQLVGARVGNRLDAAGSGFDNGPHVAINADGLVTGSDAILRGVRVVGELRLRNAQIGGDLNFRDGQLKGSGKGRALRATGIAIKGSLYLTGSFSCAGGVRLAQGRIGGELDCTGARLRRVSPDGNNALEVFSAPGINVKGALIWRGMPAPPEGAVNLIGAEVGQICDDLTSWPAAGTINIENFVYGSFDKTSLRTKDRLEWLRRQRTFSPQPYEQVIQVLRRTGLEKEARRIAKAKHDDLRRKGGLSVPARAWNWFLGFTIGHGYQVWRALVISLIVVAVGAGVFELSFRDGVMTPVKDWPADYVAGTRCPVNVPCFEPLAFSADVFLPILDLRQDSYWLPVNLGPNAQFFRGYLWLHIILGWVLTTVGVAGLTGLVKKE
jgi:hypothetical protein